MKKPERQPPVGKLPWFKFWSDDWLIGTTDLTFEERGAYIAILALIYSTMDRLENDDRRIAARCGVDVRTFRRVRDRLVSLGKLQIEDGFLRNQRATTEIAKAVELTESARRSGRTSGKDPVGIGRRSDEDPAGIAHDLGQECDPKSTPDLSNFSSVNEKHGGTSQSQNQNQVQHKKDSPHATTNENDSRETEMVVAVAERGEILSYDGPEANRVVDCFLDLRKDLWPAERRPPSTRGKLLKQAAGFLSGGATALMVCDALTHQMRRAAAIGNGAPTGLSAYERSVPEALAPSDVRIVGPGSGWNGRQPAPKVSTMGIARMVFGDNARYGEEDSGVESDHIEPDDVEGSDDEISNAPMLLPRDRSKRRLE